jgi:hypothetical protein
MDSKAVDFPDSFHVIPSPGLFRVESESFNLDQRLSHRLIIRPPFELSYVNRKGWAWIGTPARKF